MSVGRPSKLLEQEGRKKDIPRRAIGPFRLDQPDEMNLIEEPERRGLCVDQMHTTRTGARREGLSFDPTPDGSGNLRKSSVIRLSIVR